MSDETRLTAPVLCQRKRQYVHVQFVSQGEVRVLSQVGNFTAHAGDAILRDSWARAWVMPAAQFNAEYDLPASSDGRGPEPDEIVAVHRQLSREVVHSEPYLLSDTWVYGRDPVYATMTFVEHGEIEVDTSDGPVTARKGDAIVHWPDGRIEVMDNTTATEGWHFHGDI